VAAAATLQRRAIFIDVENTSSEATLEQVIEHLKVDRKAQRTEMTAVGNWKSVGSRVARMLGAHGVQLVHSAPAPGVRDWSDLWIAVVAGRWLALAQPGDVLDIVSDDHAFDAVGDAAAATGIEFHRISYRTLGGGAQAAPTVAAHRPNRRGGRRRWGRGAARPGESVGGQPPVSSGPAEHAPLPERPRIAAVSPPAALSADEEAHAASLEQVRTSLARLTAGDSRRWVNIDVLANALKSEGFSRPPGSPRLVTRLRHIKGVEVSPSGMVRFAGEVDAGTAPTGAPSEEPEAAPAAESRARRPHRRGGRRHRRPAEGSGEGAAPAPAEAAPPSMPEGAGS